MNIQRIAATLAVPVVAAALAWLGGYDFNERSFGLAYASFWTICFTLFVWAFPGWKK